MIPISFTTFCLILVSITNVVASKKNNNLITVKIKSLKCENINPKIYNGTVKCGIKPTRDGRGITNIRYFYRKPANDLWLQVKVFYKFLTGTQFLPWMVDVDFDVCKFAGDLKGLSGFAFLFMKSMAENGPGMIHPCPYIGEEGMKDGDAQEIMGGSVPQIIPKGLYKLFLRYHLKNNETFLIIHITGQIDANDPLKAFEMGK